MRWNKGIGWHIWSELLSTTAGFFLAWIGAEGLVDGLVSYLWPRSIIWMLRMHMWFPNHGQSIMLMFSLGLWIVLALSAGIGLFFKQETNTLYLLQAVQFPRWYSTTLGILLGGLVFWVTSLSGPALLSGVARSMLHGTLKGSRGIETVALYYEENKGSAALAYGALTKLVNAPYRSSYGPLYFLDASWAVGLHEQSQLKVALSHLQQAACQTKNPSELASWLVFSSEAPSYRGDHKCEEQQMITNAVRELQRHPQVWRHLPTTVAEAAAYVLRAKGYANLSWHINLDLLVNRKSPEALSEVASDASTSQEVHRGLQDILRLGPNFTQHRFSWDAAVAKLSYEAGLCSQGNSAALRLRALSIPNVWNIETFLQISQEARGCKNVVGST